MLRIGTAGWGLPREWQASFPADGSHLQRYAGVFNATEINSSFYRPHRRSTYVRWGSSVPAGFKFAVKLPRAITHDQALVAADVLLEVFLEEVSGLAGTLGPLLVQLPPSQAFDYSRADDFLGCLRELHGGLVAVEPRHPTWFEPSAADLLVRYRVARVAADPGCVPAASRPGGWPGLLYTRLHGSPRMYYSSYSTGSLAMIRAALDDQDAPDVERWCMFDNTTLGAATGNALELAHWPSRAHHPP